MTAMALRPLFRAGGSVVVAPQYSFFFIILSSLIAPASPHTLIVNLSPFGVGLWA